MPMMWISIYFFTLIFLMIIITLIYFFYIPNALPPKSKSPKTLSKWIWMW